MASLFYTHSFSDLFLGNSLVYLQAPSCHCTINNIELTYLCVNNVLGYVGGRRHVCYYPQMHYGQTLGLVAWQTQLSPIVQRL